MLQQLLELTDEGLSLITAIAYILAALRMAYYQRGTSRFRRGISTIASLLGGTLFISGLEILLNREPVSIWHSANIVLLCVLVFRSRGNVAALLRPTQ
ncbi:phage holin family protein [Pseudomonas sp. C9-3]|uniref:phage holin family protein n=1 Tax=Pseudomonas sp. C9-3 TaxID=3078264 RepID=UPI0028ED5C9A|nr:phage holin family protein [Pseudomonas sp. C9-3]